ncbi:DUF2760 domain-containing protein [Aeoliella sp. ICT_H6.2]|uniref:DUF2760 domain-containing protein n=1 Tax=Aeoliella straminimaris TaxID=2954799 RepID=A0A9X2FC29_9BACT|nr:DUF2760 domain-containing protein [Aeoliella straminimaris]MCO6045483.1 DUF2760 domain-containing protein [Aeoliella straminimaris]
MRLWLAIQSFFQVLFNRDFAAGVKQLQLAAPAAEPAQAEPAKPEPPKPQPPKPQPPVRSEAITLLATLQREARFVDIVSESLDGYSDAQIGAAARDVLRDCGKVIERMFALQPFAAKTEGEQIEVPAGYDAAEFRLTGNVSAQPPVTGELVHAGWKATKCEVPKWSGSKQAALVVAPAEVQVG